MDPGEWAPVAKARAYESVLDQIEGRILDGRLQVGDRLPAERELAEMLGVSRAAVREAIRALEVQGVLHGAVGAGRDGGTTVVASPSASLTRFLRMHVALANFPMSDVVEARVMLERQSAALAARHHDDEVLAELRSCLTTMEDPQTARSTFNVHDTRFHVAIAEAGGNVLVTDMTSAIRAAMEAPILESFHAMPDWPGVSSELCRGHRAIYEAIEARDEIVAADAVEAHIRYAFSILDYRRGA